MAKDTANSNRVKRWLSNALFNTASPTGYFETLVEGIDPMWSLQTTKARVERIHKETADTLTISLRPNQRFTPFQAGQHVQVGIELKGALKTRTFTIASSPGEWRHQGTIELTIKAIPNGQVTQWIHKELKPGQVVRLGEPSGDFLLPTGESKSTLYIAGGSGITPVMSHLRELIEQGLPYPVSLLYYARKPGDFIFEAELEAIAKQCKNFNLYFVPTQTSGSEAKLTGHICADHLARAVKFKPAHIYICGPQALQDSAKEVTSDCFDNTPLLHTESFGLAIAHKGDATTAQPVVLQHSQKTIECAPNTPLLVAAEQNGLTPNYGCRMGICYTCKCKKQSGVVRNAVTGQLSGNDEEDIQLCVSIPETPVVIDL